MKIWLPFVVGGSGTDTFTRTFARFLEKAGHTPVVQPFSHWFQYLPDALRLVRPPAGTDLVFTNSWNGFAFSKTGLPMVTMEQLCVHDPAFAEFRSMPQAIFHNTMVRWFEGRTFKSANRVVAVSEATKTAVEGAFPGTHPVVIPNGVDTDFFKPSKEPMPARGAFRLLFVGNLTRRKGADLLAPIMDELGDGYELHFTSGLRVRSHPSIRNGYPLGSLGPEEVRTAYQTADAFLFPTRLEGLPLSVLEAMACGLPVVGSDLSSMPEAVVDGVTGFLRPLIPGELAAAVRLLANDRVLRSQMATNSRIRAVEDFGMDTTVRRYLQVFGENVRA
jgi:glycosyltransferase involved in cell wall biosynthesis